MTERGRDDYNLINDSVIVKAHAKYTTEPDVASAYERGLHFNSMLSNIRLAEAQIGARLINDLSRALECEAA